MAQTDRQPVFKSIIEQVERNARVLGPETGKTIRRRIVHEDVKPSVQPLLTDRWHQYYEPYDLCTPLIDDKPCVAGCVATAMAQVMHYWRYPEHGYGTHTYFDEKGCGQELTCDFSQHVYDWDNMLDDYEGVNYTPAQGYAVAQLMSDCGIAVNMRYGVDASGANSVNQPKAMYEHFGYDKSAQMHYRDFYTLDEFTLMMKRELSAGRPILISAHSSRIGHAFVCDGYDERDYFHFSFGNPSGEGDAWIYLPYLTPDFPFEQDVNDPENGLNLLQSIHTNIMPETNPAATGVESHVFAMTGMSILPDGRIVTGNLCNLGWNMHTGKVCLALKHGDDIVSLPYTYTHEFLLEEIDDTVYCDTISLAIPESIGDGTYKLVPVFSEGDGWVEVRTSIGVPNHLLVNRNNGSTTVLEDTARTSCLTLEDISFPSWMKPQTYPECTLTLRCHNSEFCGRFYIMLEDPRDSTLIMFAEQGLSLGKDEEVTRNLHRTYNRIPEGTYTLRLFYDQDLFSTDLQPLEMEEEQTVIVSASDPTQIVELRTGKPQTSRYALSGIRLAPDASFGGIVIENGVKRKSR